MVSREEVYTHRCTHRGRVLPTVVHTEGECYPPEDPKEEVIPTLGYPRGRHIPPWDTLEGGIYTVVHIGRHPGG